MKIAHVNPESKVIIVGAPGAGKTSIVQQYAHGTFESAIESTVAAAHISVKNFTKSGVAVTLNIWDTAGQEKYRSIIPMYSRNAAAAIIVTDLSSVDSFNANNDWYNIVKESCPMNCKVYVVGNKMDLPPAFPQEELKSWAEEKGFPFFLTSAMDRDTVLPLFNRISEDLSTGPLASGQPTKIVIKKDTKDAKEDLTECC